MGGLLRESLGINVRRRPRKIFISYRRDDGAGHAAHLRHCLAEDFGDEAIFFDVKSIDLGIPYKDAIREAVAESDVLLAVIGPRWLSAAAPDGSRRLDDLEDLTRFEIATALGLDRRVVPVLVHRAQMPRAEELPDDLKPLVGNQAFELRDERWAEDAELLSLKLSGGHSPVWRRLLAVAAAVLLLAAAGVYLFDKLRNDGSEKVLNDDRAETCWERPFAGIPAERTTDLPANIISHPVSRTDQPLDAPWAVRLVELDRRLGAVALRFYPVGEQFKIEGVVDRECRPATFEKVVEDGIDRNVLVNWRTITIHLGEQDYTLRLGHDAGKILGTLNKAPDKPGPQ